MHSELKHYNRVKEKLQLIVDHLCMRHEGLTTESEKMIKKLKEQEDKKNVKR
jgi:hypothetical protein